MDSGKIRTHKIELGDGDRAKRCRNVLKVMNEVKNDKQDNQRSDYAFPCGQLTTFATRTSDLSRS